jgi:hypothetical protein
MRYIQGTYFHLEMDWGLDKTNVLKNVIKIENILIRQLAKERITVEHVQRKLNIFRILSSRYRNRRRRFGLRLNLIAGIYNYELSLLPDLAIA